MATAVEVGVYVRQAGVWERANGGTPIGFSGPQVRAAGVWENSLNVQGKASGSWEITWVNIDSEINVPDISAFNLSAFDFSGPSYSGDVQIRFDADGELKYRVFNDNSPAPAYTVVSGAWRPYDCGRDYQIFWEERRRSGNFTTIFTFQDGLAVEDTWVDITSDVVFNFSGFEFDTGLFAATGEFDFTVKVREKLSAPSAGNDLGQYDCTIELGFGI